MFVWFTARVFAKPFIAAFPHDDGVTCLARNPQVLNGVVRQVQLMNAMACMLMCKDRSLIFECMFCTRYRPGI